MELVKPKSKLLYDYIISETMPFLLEPAGMNINDTCFS